MATTLTSASFFCLLIWILNAISSYPAASSSKTSSPVRPRTWAIKLIHHDSIHSPYYNPNATISERAERAINSSLARIRSLSRQIATPNDNDIRVGLNASNFGFLAKISIGTPPVPQLVMIDTGSDLFWTQCLPCTDCFRQSSPLFDPSKSSTYSNINCDPHNCAFPNKCDPNPRNCAYKRSYADGSTTAGNLATEQATFETSDEGTVKVPIEMLGCGHANKIRVEGGSGMLGLSYGFNGKPSLIRQFGSKFSYCIGNVHDTRYQYNQLILGDGAIIQGDSTSLVPYTLTYYVELQGISVGEKKLEIDPKEFRRGPSGGGVIIDSGATYTFLREEAYVQLQNEVERLMKGRLYKVYHPRFLCYIGNVDRDLTGFPTVNLLFSNNVQLSLDTNSLFFQLHWGVLCMACLPSSPKWNNLSIIGVMAQQSYNVGYDVKQRKIFFQRIDCSLLESSI